MQLPTTQRRAVLAGIAASLLPMRAAIAQFALAGGDWFSMVQAHHALVAQTFERLLASERSTYLAREQLVRLLGYQLTAHSVAEENVIYPALALRGMTSEAERLYLDQAHAKVLNAQLEMQARMKDRGNWMEPARAMRDAVLRHAREDEEGRLYPQLRAMLDPAANAALTAGYQREFDSVKLVRE